MLLLYNILITLLWPLLVFYPPFRGTLRQRIGGFDLTGYDPRQPGLKVLINAVSAGEVVAISGFIRQLLKLRPDARIVLLTTTQSGQEMARKNLDGMLAALLYFPLIDLPFAVRRYLDRLQPDLYITTEAEIWPNIQLQCHRRGIPVALVNARIYLHNKTGLRKRIVRKLYDLVDLLVCQDEDQLSRFVDFGVAREKLKVSGNIKFDFEIEPWTAEQLDSWKAKWGLGAKRTVVLGSSHAGEEAMLLNACQCLGEAAGRKVQFVIAPRRTDRAVEVAQLARGMGLEARLMSEQENEPVAPDVLVVDRYGVLVDMYRVADIVVMGGTFSPRVGGHNILEATALARPVIVGPHVFSIANQLELFKGQAGLLEVTGESGQDQTGNLRNVLTGLLADPAKAGAVGERAQRITDANRGSAARAAEIVLEYVEQAREID